MTDVGASATTPASAGSSTTPAAASATKASAPKDRTCPYCNIAFTSSSLGRHLDLYIKEKNPKPPDGIHNVDEIRKSRGNITRRQAKSSVAKRRQQEVERAAQDAAQNGANGASPVNAQDMRHFPQHLRQIFNTPHWTSTGVITEREANVQFLSGYGSTPQDSVKKDARQQHDPSTRRKWHEERERGRAAELALQEVLDSIKAAAAGRAMPEIYDFDFFAQSFPSLCLRILSAPPTMHMPTLIPDPEAWPLEAPGQATFDVLRRKISLHLLKWRDDFYPPNPRKRQRSEGNDTMSTEPHESEVEPVPLYMHHLRTAYTSWVGLPEGARQREWHIEIMRAFAWERQEHRKTQSRIEYLETELARAKLDNARLTECQMPREWLHAPAQQLPVARLAAEKVERALNKEGLDADKLIDKWRSRVQAAKSASRRAEDGDEREVGRLVMIGPAHTGNRPRGEGLYDGGIPDESDEDDADEEDSLDDYKDNDSPDGRDPGDTRNDPIRPSIRSQLESLAAGRTQNGSR